MSLARLHTSTSGTSTSGTSTSGHPSIQYFISNIHSVPILAGSPRLPSLQSPVHPDLLRGLTLTGLSPFDPSRPLYPLTLPRLSFVEVNTGLDSFLNPRSFLNRRERLRAPIGSRNGAGECLVCQPEPPYTCEPPRLCVKLDKTTLRTAKDYHIHAEGSF